MKNEKDKQSSKKLSTEEVATTIVAIEEGKKLGITPFQAGVAMGVRNIILGRNKKKNK